VKPPGPVGLDLEPLSVLTRPEPLVLDASQADPDLLSRVPTVTVLAGRAPAAVAAWFDVCVTDEPDPPAPWVNGTVDAVGAAVRAHPLAALALVSLLRQPPAGVWPGLTAESATYAALLGSAEFSAWRAARGPIRVIDDDAVRVWRDGDALSITLDRPAVHNAFNRSMRDGLVEALRVAAADPGIRRVLWRGAGPSFSSGGDLDEFGAVGDPATAHAVRLTRHPGWWVHAVRDRIDVVVHGACMGAGIELPAFAARVVARPDARFALPEVGMGLIPGAGGTVSVPARVGRQRAGWLALTGAVIDAPTALAWGLVDALSPGEATDRRSPS